MSNGSDVSFVETIKKVVMAIGGLTVLGSIVLTFVDVIARNALNKPIPGVLEITTYWFMVPMVAVGIWVSAVARDHVRVTLITETVGPNTYKLLMTLVTAVSAAFLFYLSYLGFIDAYSNMQQGEYAGVYRTLVWPVRYLLAFSLFAFGAVIVLQLVAVLTGRDAAREQTNEDTEIIL